MTPPLAERRPVSRTLHGETVTDDYAWLRDRDDPAVVPYLEAENAHTEAATAHLAPLREAIFQEIKDRVLETDLSVPVRKGDWWYYSRTVEGLSYAIHCRRPSEDDSADEQVLLDENVEAQGHEFFSVGAFSVSPDHRWLAWSTDFEGDEQFTLRVRDLSTGEDLPDVVAPVGWGAEWGDNSVVYYTTLDEAQRPYRLHRHRLGTEASTDELVFEEADERFFLDVSRTRSDAFVVISLESKTTTEEWLLDAADPEARPRVVLARRDGVEYHVDHHRDSLFLLTNDGAVDFRVVQAPLANPAPAGWVEALPSREGVRVEDIDAFADHLVVWQRENALLGPTVIPLAEDGREPFRVEFPDPVYVVHGGANPEFDTTTLRLTYRSLVTPDSVYDFDMATRELTLLKRQPVLGGYDPEQYETFRLWAPAEDGRQVPVSVVRRRDATSPAPTLLYGYGSYEISIDPSFSVARLSLLDRGVTFAIAHIRGGGEMGRRWYEEGKLQHKATTFTDFVAAAETLVAASVTAPGRLAIRGGSAGGLLMGAVTNARPDLFAAVVAEVPFVDVISTMLDASLPLTVTEWEEWGNPEDPATYKAMRAYAPFENVGPVPYPAMLVTAGLNDPRVGYWEPAKWVARLRAEGHGQGPILLKTDLGAGHAGPSGRYEKWRDEAFVLSFILDQLGLAAR